MDVAVAGESLGDKSKSVGLVGVAALIGALGGFFLPYLTGPSHEDIRDAARSLVPPGTRITESGETTGHPLVSGPYHASVYFTAGKVPSGDLVTAVRKTAQIRDWQLVSTEDIPGGALLSYRREGVAARVQLAIEPPGRKIIIAERDEDSFNDSRLAAIGAGVVVGVVVARTVERRRRRPAGTVGRSTPPLD